MFFLKFLGFFKIKIMVHIILSNDTTTAFMYQLMDVKYLVILGDS